MSKFYCIVRSDLPAGYQAVQGAHALLDFAVRYPEEIKEWNLNSNYLIMLQVKDEEELLDFLYRANSLGIKTVGFNEPDIGNELTAIALEPGEQSRLLCSGLRLALDHAQGSSGDGQRL